MKIEGFPDGDSVVDLDAQRTMMVQKGSCNEDLPLVPDLDSWPWVRVVVWGGRDADFML